MTETPETAPEHDENADMLVGEPVAPEHDLDVQSFDEEDDASEVDAPVVETGAGEDQ
jgi:hypothetical protein